MNNIALKVWNRFAKNSKTTTAGVVVLVTTGLVIFGIDLSPEKLKATTAFIGAIGTLVGILAND